MNILTFDVEEWFHLLDNSSTKTEAEWGKYEVRIYENMERIFRLLEETNSTATFFIIGWVAKTYPDIVKKIAERYEIGSHTMSHQLVWQQSKKEFKEDISTSIKTLEDITGKPVKYFRAPGFSIRKNEAWAFETLKELGIEVDCSVFPAKHAHGGLPECKTSKPCIIKYGNTIIKELPVTTKRILGQSIIFSGGGYFRLLPYWLIKAFAKSCDNYLMTYIHPRDLDAGQPIIQGLPLKRQFKSYVNLGKSEAKLRKFLQDFKFVDASTAVNMIDWDNVPTIEL